MKKKILQLAIFTTIASSIMLTSACSSEGETQQETFTSLAPPSPVETPSNPPTKHIAYNHIKPSYNTTPSVTPAPDIHRDVKSDNILEVIQPMDHWTNKQVETKDGKYKISFNDPDPETSILQFDDFVNGIAGFDVYKYAFDSNINVHSCRVPEDLSGVDDCYALFRTRIGKQWYDLTVDLGYYDEGRTPRAVEIYAYPRSSYSYNAAPYSDWEY